MYSIFPLMHSFISCGESPLPVGIWATCPPPPDWILLLWHTVLSKYGYCFPNSGENASIECCTPKKNSWCQGLCVKALHACLNFWVQGQIFWAFSHVCFICQQLKICSCSLCCVYTFRYCMSFNDRLYPYWRKYHFVHYYFYDLNSLNNGIIN